MSKTSLAMTRRGLVASSAILGAAAALPARAALAPAGGLDLAPYRGKVVYLDFWASWCGPCRLSFPYMQRLSASFSAKPFVLIAVNVDHSRQRADAFLSEFGPDIHVIYDPEGRLALKYGVREMPTSVVIDKSGRVRFTHNGFYEDQEAVYEDHIMSLLNEH